MTERQHLQRARMLAVYCAAGCTNAQAWRKANPGCKASDKSAAEMCRRELIGLGRWMEDHPGVVPPDGDWRKALKYCIGVTDRPCGKEIDRGKRCPACAAKQKRLSQPGYRRTYYEKNREPANAARSERHRKQHQKELDAAAATAAAAAKRKEEKRRANTSWPVEHDGKQYRYYPMTVKWEILSYRDIYDQVGEYVPVPPGYPVPPVPLGAPVPDWWQRQRAASQPDEAPTAASQPSKQQNPAASSGKKRRADANGASPKRRPRCKTCAHPDLAAIDAELLQGILSLRTIAGRHGLSSTCLDRHRRQHVKEPTVGDILEPAATSGNWREWDGAEWRQIPAPRREDLVEIKGRPSAVRWRRGWNLQLNCAVGLKVYRRRRSR